MLFICYVVPSLRLDAFSCAIVQCVLFMSRGIIRSQKHLMRFFGIIICHLSKIWYPVRKFRIIVSFVNWQMSKACFRRNESILSCSGQIEFPCEFILKQKLAFWAIFYCCRSREKPEAGRNVNVLITLWVKCIEVYFGAVISPRLFAILLRLHLHCGF